MSRDLAVDVEKLIKTSNPYLKKKSILCKIVFSRSVTCLILSYSSPAISRSYNGYGGSMSSNLLAIRREAILSMRIESE